MSIKIECSHLIYSNDFHVYTFDCDFFCVCETVLGFMMNYVRQQIIRINGRELE